MPGMPYMLEVGRVMSWVTDYVENPGHLRTLFDQLRGHPRHFELTEIDALNSTNPLNQTVPDPVNPGANIRPDEHLARDWLGWTEWHHPPRPGQPQFLAGNPKPTGWWIRWYGDADDIIRKTLLCATEIALDVPRGGTTPSSGRHWHMQFLWVCGSPFFQGWVNWQEWDENDPQGGNVTVTFTTPGNGHPLYATPRRPAGAPAPDDGYEDPAQTVDEYGLWVIGQDKVDVLRPNKTPFHISGAGFLPAYPNAFIHTKGDPIVVSPAEIDGGVLPTGRDWQ
jgi:hypothetical protein